MKKLKALKIYTMEKKQPIDRADKNNRLNILLKEVNSLKKNLFTKMAD